MLTELELKQVIELLIEIKRPFEKLMDLFKRKDYDRRYKH